MSNYEGAALVITGTIGAGKTTIIEAISAQLRSAGLLHGVLDLDWLNQLSPAPDPLDPYNDGLRVTNLEAVWSTFYARGARHAVISGTIVSREQLEAIRETLPGLAVTVCLLVCPSDLVKERIKQRTRGRLLEDFLSRTEGLAQTIEEANIHDFVGRNGDRLPEEVAAEIVDQLDWL
ncbi:MAG: hypothetical protein QOK47_476 [Actinomycetota bacterium]|nr:hypothetical protein [Actinomycetota bacterium]